MALDLPNTGDVLLRVLIAIICGSIIGLERDLSDKVAGLRTHILVCLGSALFTIISIEFTGFDPKIDASRVSAQIVTGIGFLGAGTILKQGVTVTGLTTAASLWVIASIGMACGFGDFISAGIVTFFSFTVLFFITRFPIRFIHKARRLVGFLSVTYKTGSFREIMELLKNKDINVVNIKASIGEENKNEEILHLWIKVPIDVEVEELLKTLKGINGVRSTSVELETHFSHG